MRTRITLLLLVLLMFSTNLVSAFIAPRPPEKRLTKRGYELTEEAMRGILAEGFHSLAFSACIEYCIEQQYTSLIHEIEDYLKMLEEHVESRKYKSETAWQNAGLATELRRMLCIRALFTLDKKMSAQDRDRYLRNIRYEIFERKSAGPPLASYKALLSANEYQNVDIKDDLILLNKSDILPGIKHLPRNSLFELYGDDSLTESEVMDILSASKNTPKDYNSVLSKAHKKGMLLTTEPIEEEEQCEGTGDGKQDK